MGTRITYQQKGKHRKRCPVCSKLVQDGEQAVLQKVKVERAYPVKGLMWFVRWYVTHVECVERAAAREAELAVEHAQQEEAFKQQVMGILQGLG